MFVESMGAIFEIFNAKMGFLKHPTFACFALFFTKFSIFIREISKTRKSGPYGPFLLALWVGRGDNFHMLSAEKKILKIGQKLTKLETEVVIYIENCSNCSYKLRNHLILKILEYLHNKNGDRAEWRLQKKISPKEIIQNRLIITEAS